MGYNGNRVILHFDLHCMGRFVSHEYKDGIGSLRLTRIMKTAALSAALLSAAVVASSRGAGSRLAKRTNYPADAIDLDLWKLEVNGVNKTQPTLDTYEDTTRFYYDTWGAATYAVLHAGVDDTDPRTILHEQRDDSGTNVDASYDSADDE